MMSLYGGTGLGSNGLGVGGLPQDPMSALAALHGSGMMPGGSGAPMSASPLSSYIGAMGGGGGGVMMHPMAAPNINMGASQGPQGLQQAMAGLTGGGANGGLLQLLQALKGQQTGVQPQGAQPGTTINQVAPQSPQDLLNAAPTQTMQQNAVAPPVPGQQMQPGMMGPAQMQGDPNFFMRLIAGLKSLGNSGGMPTSGA